MTIFPYFIIALPVGISLIPKRISLADNHLPVVLDISLVPFPAIIESCVVPPDVAILAMLNYEGKLFYVGKKFNQHI